MTADDPRALEVFTCEHFRCSLTKKACLRRQGARRRLRNGKTETDKAVYELCASGTCAQGNEIRAELGEAPIELVNRPTPPAPVEEDVMPRGVRTEPCPKCGSRSTLCPTTCPTRARAGKAARPARGRRGDRVAVVERELEADELLARREALLVELSDVERLLALRLEAEEAKVRRMREAISGRQQGRAEGQEEAREAAA